jgi:pseudaminic acid cytidylyltransferase
MRLCIIPARGGSKRIPRKNIKIFGGQPIIAWTISAALKSRCFGRVIVSTDDPEISEVAKAHGAEVPFVRPRELSDDHSGTVPVIAHAIGWQNAHGQRVSEACCIYATAPFVQAGDIVKGLNVLLRSSADYAFSVTNYGYPIQRALRIMPNQRVEMLQTKHLNSRSQDLEDAWHDAGQFYWGRADAWLEQKPVFGPSSAAVPLPRYRVQDIDTPEDWTQAELMFNCLKLYSKDLYDFQD